VPQACGRFQVVIALGAFELAVELVERERPDVLCLQEIKVAPDHLVKEIAEVPGYWCAWHGMKGYSGVALHVRRDFAAACPAITHPPFDHETRIAVADITAAAGSFAVASIYVPNGGKDFPAKIRFLEDKGLVKPERTPSGYRKFSVEDIDRLRYVLRMQRDHYLPLRVIGEHLDAIDRGLEPPPIEPVVPTVPTVSLAADGLPSAESFRRRDHVRLSRKELLKIAEIDVHPSERNPRLPGQLPEERALFAGLLDAAGLHDLGRELDPSNDAMYSWWAPWRNMRARNIGWRLDYVLASDGLAARITTCPALREVGTSDHAPVIATFGDPGPRS